MCWGSGMARLALITPASASQGWAGPCFPSSDITEDFVPPVLFQVPFFVAALSPGVQVSLWDGWHPLRLVGDSGESVSHKGWMKWGAMNTTHTLSISFKL